MKDFTKYRVYKYLYDEYGNFEEDSSEIIYIKKIENGIAHILRPRMIGCKDECKPWNDPMWECETNGCRFEIKDVIEEFIVIAKSPYWKFEVISEMDENEIFISDDKLWEEFKKTQACCKDR